MEERLEEASRIVKEYAERQPVKVELAEEQLAALLKQWDDGDPSLPAKVTFYVRGREVMQFQVASYRYRGDTCCV